MHALVAHIAERHRQPGGAWASLDDLVGAARSASIGDTTPTGSSWKSPRWV
jgi:hypothetical protein